MDNKSLVLDLNKQLGIIVSVGAISLTMLPYNKKLCDKWSISKEQFLYLKMHFKNNPTQALKDLLDTLKGRSEQE